jgi:hypothetical protein
MYSPKCGPRSTSSRATVLAAGRSSWIQLSVAASTASVQCVSSRPSTAARASPPDDVVTVAPASVTSRSRGRGGAGGADRISKTHVRGSLYATAACGAILAGSIRHMPAVPGGSLSGWTTTQRTPISCSRRIASGFGNRKSTPRKNDIVGVKPL